jgi:hypothetical protein
MQLYRYLLSLLSLAMAGLLLSLSSAYHVSVVRAHGATLRVPSSPNQKESIKQLILGVLEHHSEEDKGHGVRVLFYEENGQWKAFPTDFNTEKELSQAVRSFPEAVTWTICFDGRALGTLASKTPPRYSQYADIGVQQITSKGSVPTVGQPSSLFSGWPGGRTYRPLVLNSRPYCGDSGKWRPEKPEQDEISAIKDYLGKTFQVSASKLSKATIKVNKSYGSQGRGVKLISLDIARAEVIPVEGENDQNTGAWFYVKGREVRYLGSNMLLVDIGDYDQDGHEEALFKIQRYNNDGYTLHFDGFKQKVEFSWSYH